MLIFSKKIKKSIKDVIYALLRIEEQFDREKFFE